MPFYLDPLFTLCNHLVMILLIRSDQSIFSSVSSLSKCQQSEAQWCSGPQARWAPEMYPLLLEEFMPIQLPGFQPKGCTWKNWNQHSLVSNSWLSLYTLIVIFLGSSKGRAISLTDLQLFFLFQPGQQAALIKKMFNSLAARMALGDISLALLQEQCQWSLRSSLMIICLKIQCEFLGIEIWLRALGNSDPLSQLHPCNLPVM